MPPLRGSTRPRLHHILGLPPRLASWTDLVQSLQLSFTHLVLAGGDRCSGTAVVSRTSVECFQFCGIRDR